MPLKNHDCVNDMLDVITRKLAKEKYLYKGNMTAKKLKEILVYEPPAKKPLIFKGHQNGDCQYIPEFLPRLINYAYNGEYGDIKNFKKFCKPNFLLNLINEIMTYKDRDLSLSKYKEYNEKVVINDNTRVRFIVTFSKCKILFTDLDAYRLLEPNSLYIIGKKIKNFKIIGDDFLMLY